MKGKYKLILAIIIMCFFSCKKNIEKKRVDNEIIIDSIEVHKITGDLSLSSEKDKIRFFLKLPKHELPDTLTIRASKKFIKIYKNLRLNEKIKTKFIYDFLIPREEGYTLKVILDNYKSFVNLNDENIMIYDENSAMFKLNKSESFFVKYYLNRKLISKNDSISLNIGLAFPKPR